MFAVSYLTSCFTEQIIYSGRIAESGKKITLNSNVLGIKMGGSGVKREK